MSARCGKCRGLITEPARCQNGHEQPTDSLERIAGLMAERIDYDRLADAVAQRLAKFVPDLASPDEAMVDVKEKARLLGVSPDTVYEHADELGVERVGRGPKALLRFPRDCQPSDPDVAPPPRAPAPRPTHEPAAGVSLLPVRGERLPLVARRREEA
jgi:hypothetical protein